MFTSTILTLCYIRIYFKLSVRINISVYLSDWKVSCISTTTNFLKLRIWTKTIFSYWDNVGKKCEVRHYIFEIFRKKKNVLNICQSFLISMNKKDWSKSIVTQCIDHAFHPCCWMLAWNAWKWYIKICIIIILSQFQNFIQLCWIKDINTFKKLYSDIAISIIKD